MTNSMKILYVIPKISTGGIEKIVEQWIRELKDRGVECDILSFSMGENAAFERLGCKVSICNVSIVHINKAKKELNNFFKENRYYDVVHSHVSFANGIVCECVKRNLPLAKTVCHAHSNGSNKYSSFFSKGIHAFIFSYCKRLIKKYSELNLACSYKSGDYLYGNRNNYIFFPNAIDVRKFRFSCEKRIQYRAANNLNDKFVIINAGRFSIEKNHQFILSIFTEIVKVKPNAVLVLIGDGELRKEIKDICNVSDLLREKVLFLGYRSDVSELYSMSDLFLLPSIIEGFPVSVVEAQANGLPCFVSEATPKEAVMTDLVERLQLSTEAKIWAEMIINFKTNQERRIYNDIIEDCGFDVKDSINNLIRMYND